MRERRASGAIILDRRRASRMPMRFDVTYSHGSDTFSATARNLTTYGIFVETEESVPTGASIELVLHLPDDGGGPAKVMSQVTRPARRRDEVPGFAAEFTGLGEATKSRIAALKDETS